MGECMKVNGHNPGVFEIAVILFCCAFVLSVLVFGIWIGHTVESRHTQTAISNAIAYCPEVQNCDTQQALTTLKGMADNGHRMESHRICWTKGE